MQRILISNLQNLVEIAESRHWKKLEEEEQSGEASSLEEKLGHAMVPNTDFDDNRK